jgi:hypothetical protein
VKLLRFVLLVLIVVLSGLTAFGFAANTALSDEDGFVTDMGAAIQDPQVQAEVQQQVRSATKTALQELAAQGGIAGSLVGTLDPDALAGAAAAAVDTSAFQSAWRSWSQLLSQGLVDTAYGLPNSDVTVSGQIIEVKIGPLVSPLLASSPVGDLGSVAAGLFGDRTLNINTGEDLETSLTRLGSAAEARWWFLAGAVFSIVVVVALAAPRLWSLSGALIASAVGVVLAQLVLILGKQSSGQSQTPALSSTISDSFVAGATLQLIVVAGVLSLASVFVAILTTHRKTTGPQQQVGLNPLPTQSTH